MQGVLLTSKITLPMNTGKIVERERLTQLLQRGSRSKLLFVRAPAGYGKTTMLSQWAIQHEGPIAWFTVDVTDNDLLRFWEYVAYTVFASFRSSTASSILSMFHAQSSFSSEKLIDSLLNEISLLPGNIQIIIDDYHLIENANIHAMMEQFMNYLPSNTKVCLSSRMDLPLPFAKWREKSWLSEIGIEQLRLTYEEGKEFYEQQNIVFDHAHHLQTVVDVTEGWAAGLQLAGLSLASDSERDGDFSQFDGRHPFVAEFLMKEVFETLSPSSHFFLLCTSILDQLTPEICDKLTRRSDSHERLHELEKKGLFIIRLHEKEPIFRYHNLLTETLRSELENRYADDFIVLMNEKVALILYEKGDFICAIEHALNGHMYGRAEEWIMANIIDVLTAERFTVFVRWIRTLLDNYYDVNPQMKVMYAFALAALHNLEEADRILIDLESQVKMDQWMGKAEYSGAVYDFLGVKAYLIILRTGDMGQALKLIKQRLDSNKPEDSVWDAIATQYNQTESSLFRTTICSKGKLLLDENEMFYFNGFRTDAFENFNMAGYSYGIRAEKLYEWNRLEEASEEQKKAMSFRNRFQDPGLFIPMAFLESRIHALKKNFLEAHTALDNELEKVNAQHWKDALYIMKALFFLRENKVVQAENELAKTTMKNNRGLALENPFRSLVDARILLEKGQPEDALQLIIRVKIQALEEEQVTTIIESAVLEALCYSMLSNEAEALYALHEAIVRGEPYGYLRTFIDEPTIIPLLKRYLKSHRQGLLGQRDTVSLSYVEHLLSESRGQNNVLDLLTPREQEVIQLLASGASNRDIAKQLFLKEGTVRVYLTSIYEKLNVNSRTQAILLLSE
ncbi:MAG TPA: LuxR C-terminal-related transcriptional regulator [Sporosarcina psychrophila]|uniref:LuxR C-terminal-related transcriptional regulator n=1 Tax=Sporosarcina psychrophila TaxID=1476 RepID=A0A921G210_SPOPS|nr:LuxR C-terminal-related transcriptional regulator [Sporosarcina psychrophila]